MNESTLFVFGVAVSFIALAGAYIFIREQYRQAVLPALSGPYDAQSHATVPRTTEATSLPHNVVRIDERDDATAAPI